MRVSKQKIVTGEIPVVSIIVPVYKVEPYLRRCLDSICKQTFFDFEVLLIDDGSPDACGLICDDYAQQDERFSVIHTKNHGLSAARNLGIKKSRGEFITFIDSDDFVSDDMIEHMLAIQKKTQADIVSVSHTTNNNFLRDFIKSKQFTITCFNKKDALRYYLYSLIAYKNDEASAWAKLYRKEIFQNLQFPNGQFYEDMTTTFKAIMQSAIYAKSSKICYHYFQKSSGIVRSTFKNNDFDLLLAADSLYELAKNNQDNYLAKLAEIKKYRCRFTLLGKIALFGVDSNISESVIAKQLITELRQHYWQQLFSPMSFSRKMILTIMCINWSIAKFIIQIACVHRGIPKQTHKT